MRAAITTLVLCCLVAYSHAQESNQICYSTGERCFAAPDLPAIPSKPCCGNLTCTGTDAASKFSLVCETPRIDPSTDASPPPSASPPVCYGEAERCSGLFGFPLQPALPCCGILTCTALGPFGMYCEAPAAAPSSNPLPVCYAEGQRCVGAPGFPAVPFLPCCGGMTCSARDPVFGLACEVPSQSAGRCYSAGQRCIGAPGFPAVPFFPCCGDMTCTAPDPAFGLACENPVSAPSVTPSTSPSPSPWQQCYGEGQRCLGAEGFPAVPYRPCCGNMTCSANDPSYGFACENPSSASVMCYAEGQRCIGAPGFPAVPYLGCCQGMTCTARDPEYGLACENPVVVTPTPSPSALPQCYGEGQRCVGAEGFPAVPYRPCCGNMTCSANDPSYGFACETPSSPTITCHAEGQRCIGAPGFPAVPFLGCCGEMTCTARDPQYGLACENTNAVASNNASPSPSPKCYAQGERCIGAPGFPAVPYYGCCGNMTCTARDPLYGIACEYPRAVQSPAASPSASPQCYGKGQRCLGAEGFPAVPYFPCCGNMTCSANDPSYGFVCETPRTPSLRCYAEGQRCMGAPGFPAVPSLGCCQNMTCTARDREYGLVCEKAIAAVTPKASPSAPSLCYGKGQRCLGAEGFPAVPYLPCCGGMTCSANDPSYGFACETPRSPKPVCYAEGQRCMGARGFPAVPVLSCCGGMTCTATDPEYGLACEKAMAGATATALPTASPQCYEERQRCFGAPGFPAVPGLGCCGDMTCTAKDPVYGLACEKMMAAASVTGLPQPSQLPVGKI